jgi:hypothetical protein
MGNNRVISTNMSHQGKKIIVQNLLSMGIKSYRKKFIHALIEVIWHQKECQRNGVMQ